uniref:SecY-type transporter protein n=1 Tax=Tenuicylindrus belgicus TaxID=1398096 RepID=UPI00223767BF|nr:SecY-type transporter protein [Tenuicylindrus belgicus]UYC31540.1 SecY-type transporter protein [Tenuicylindrus belgicus]
MRTERQRNTGSNVLLKRILVTFGLLAFVRMGTFLPVPGIEQSYITFYLQNSPIARFVNTFSNDNFFVLGLFTLNIFPYINASILMQVLISTVPSLRKLQKEEGSFGRRRLNQIIRFICLGWSIIQSTSIAFFLKNILFDWNLQLAFEIVVCLTTGAMIVLWISELITEYGIGNGSSLLIFTNIISSLPSLGRSLISGESEGVSLITIFIAIVLFVITICGIILLQEGTRVIPLVSAKQLLQQPLMYSELPESNYIPLRLNQAGVMPIIFTATILVLPNYLINMGVLPSLDLPFLERYSKIIYWLSYFVFILIFSYFYSTIVLNPKEITNDLQKMSVTIPGVRPGKGTTYYLSQVMKRTTFLGATLLGIVSILPNIIETILQVSTFKGVGATSLLILVGVTLDITREVRNIIISSFYKDMLKTSNK